MRFILQKFCKFSTHYSIRIAFAFSVKTEHRENSTESCIVVYLFKVCWASLDLEDFFLVETANVNIYLYYFLTHLSLYLDLIF